MDGVGVLFNLNIILVDGFKIGLALILGGLVGYDREKNANSAGLRTHMLVCISATLTVVIGLNFYASNPQFNIDPMRLASAIMSGIGFLGSAAVLKSRENNSIRGITTAASILSCTALGIAVGTGLYVQAIFTTIVMLLVLKKKKLLKFMNKDKEKKEIKIKFAFKEEFKGNINHVKDILNDFEIEILKFEEIIVKDNLAEITLIIEDTKGSESPNIMITLMQVEGIIDIKRL